MFLRQSLKNCLTSPSCYSQIHCHGWYSYELLFCNPTKVVFYSAFDCYILICCFLAWFEHIYDAKITELKLLCPLFWWSFHWINFPANISSVIKNESFYTFLISFIGRIVKYRTTENEKRFRFVTLLFSHIFNFCCSWEKFMSFLCVFVSSNNTAYCETLSIFIMLSAFPLTEAILAFLIVS